MKTLSLNILDIVQNSIRAEADTIEIGIEESKADNRYVIKITDNGKGIEPELLEQVTDPFVTTRTRRRMGLGLPLLKYHAELTGGGMQITSELGKGTEVNATFCLDHLDRQPLGDIPGVIAILIAANPGIDYVYSHRTDEGEYIFSTAETMEFLGTESLNEPGLLKDIKTMISENLIDIEASGLNS